MTKSSSTPPLTSRERVLRALDGRDHDRVPRFDSYWGETVARWNAEGFTGDHDDLLTLLGADIRHALWLWTAPFPGQAQIISEDAQTKTMLDNYGATVRHWKARSGTPEHLAFGCDSPETWRSTFLPAFEAAPLQIDLAAAGKSFQRWHHAGMFVCFSGVEPFEMMRRLMGDEGMAVACVEDPEWITEIATVCTAAQLTRYQAAFDAGMRPDSLWIFGDLAYTQSMFISPSMYKELIWPFHVEMCKWAHDRGMKFIYHTDGDIRPVIPLFLEAGFDALHPLEAKAQVDIRQLAPTYGPDVTFFGNIDARVLSTNNPDLIEEEISSKLRAGMANRRYIYHSDHSVPPDVSYQSFLKIIECLDKYGNYAAARGS